MIQALTPSYIEHQNRQYCYFDNNEINQLKSAQTLNHSEDSCAILPNLDVIKVSGEQASPFLQGQLTTDVTKMPLSPVGLYLSRKGRIISLFYIIKHENNFYLFMPKDIQEVFTKQLKKYIFTQKVIIEKVNGLAVEFNKSAFDNFKINLSIEQPYVGINNQYLALINQEQIEKLKEYQEEKTLTLYGDWTWHKKNIMQKLPSIYPNTVVKFLPHDLELHLKEAIDLKKGCYIGQEIIARMHFKAKLNYRLELLTIDSEELIAPGSDLIIDNKKQGIVVDCLQDINHSNLYLVCQRK